MSHGELVEGSYVGRFPRSMVSRDKILARQIVALGGPATLPPASPRGATS